MNRRPLHAHPAAPPLAAWQLEAGALGIPGGLALRYCLTGDIGRLRLGDARDRADGLWQHTCFEAFLQPTDGYGYLEFNFTPAGAWAAYRFDGRRLGRRPLELPRPPVIAMTRGDALEVTVQLALPAGSSSWRMGLMAVLEDDAAALSYWALTHPGPRPDFHDPAGFLLEIPAT
ncbi:MAG: DOMON-like domain-containing protein [Gammaproteobacteria bacterium]|nr:DOMON-like domain-containing protein [Gammaproteobacteria bacterium]